jgi:hypothetical protein
VRSDSQVRCQVSRPYRKTTLLLKSWCFRLTRRHPKIEYFNRLYLRPISPLKFLDLYVADPKMCRFKAHPRGDHFCCPISVLSSSRRSPQPRSARGDRTIARAAHRSRWSGGRRWAEPGPNQFQRGRTRTRPRRCGDRATLDLHAQISGIVEEILVHPGVQVEAKDLLPTISASPSP